MLNEDRIRAAIAELISTIGILHRWSDNKFARGDISFDAYLDRLDYLRCKEMELLDFLDTVENELAFYKDT